MTRTIPLTMFPKVTPKRSMIYLMISVILVIYLVNRGSFVFKMLQGRQNALAIGDKETVSVITREMVDDSKENREIIRTVARTLLLHSILPCVQEHLDKNNNILEIEGNNTSQKDNSSQIPTIHPDILLKWIQELRTVVDLQKSVISFLSQPTINNHDFKSIHSPVQKCLEGQPEVLFVTPSAPQNFDKREKMRNGVLGQYVKDFSNFARLFYFLGKPSGDNSVQIQEKVNIEVGSFGDIVQEDFEDIYQHIRLKAVSMLRWSSMFCSHAQYVIRVDDDVSVEPGKLVAAMKRMQELFDNFILGRKQENWEPIRIKTHKNYLSEEEYPDALLPTFALGGLLGYPMTTVKLLYQAVLREKPIWLDDVYITGICARKVGVPLLENAEFNFQHA